MERSNYDVIKSPILTEKTSEAMQGVNTYTFLVDRKANKIEIKRAIEMLFQVKVAKVRTSLRKGKPRRLKWRWVQKPDHKRAHVRLQPDNRIDIV
jgi:large subunit ribosomal protein L23